MTVLTMRLIKGSDEVQEPFEARDWCKAHHPGSPITEIGPGGKRAAPKKRERPGREG